MIVQFRTSRDLLDTMRIGQSPAWKISKLSLKHHGTTRVHVVNWEGTLRIEGDYCEEKSIEDHPDHPPGRTVVAFTNPIVRLCKVEFANPRNPVSYHELAYESATATEPSYEANGNWPAPSRDSANSHDDE
jgi:hypothetical protein